MAGMRRRLRQGTVLALAATTLSVVGVAATTGTVAAKPTGNGDIAKARFFSFNDFHGALDAPGGSGATVNGVPAGGAEYLATTLKGLRADADAKGQKTLTVGAGDMVGASPLLSAAFHDEPSIETLNLLQMDVTSVGNHEFDEGVTELLRLQNGGCHPTDGCQDGDPFDGADFQYLAANMVYKDDRQADPSGVHHADGPGRPRRLHRHDARGHAGHREPGRHHDRGLPRRGRDREQVRRPAARQGRRGARAAHPRGRLSRQPPPTPIDPSGCANFAGAITADRGRTATRVRPRRLRSHSPALLCSLPNSAGRNDPDHERGHQRLRWSPTSPRP